MLKLRGYLRPFLVWLAVCFMLLFAQAFSDLSLPNLMSDIVNVGIQQNGIEYAAPEAISQNGMTLMRRFMTDRQRAVTEDSYEFVDAAGSGSYPNASGDIYLRKKDLDAAGLAEADTAFADAAYSMTVVLRKIAESSAQGSMGASDFSELDMERLYALLPVLDMIPQSQIDESIETASQIDNAIKNQVGIVFAKGFMDELGVDIARLQTSYILRIGLYMLAIALLGGAAIVSVSLISSRIAAGVARDLRRDLFEKVENFSNAEFDKFSTASLITRSTNDITQIQMMLMMGIRMLCYAPIMAVGGIVMAVSKSAEMSWVIAIAVIVLLGVILTVFSVALPKFKLIQKLTDTLNLVSRESLTGMLVIRAFGTRDYEVERFDRINKDVTDVSRFINRVMVTMFPFMSLIMNGISILVIWVGAKQIDAAAMQVGDLMAYLQYAIQVIMSFLFISIMFIFIPRAAVSADRIAEVLYTPLSIKDPERPQGFVQARKGCVEFKNVSFRYQDAEDYALRDISFTALPGQTTAIIGSTGSGKSTLANLILRFYDVTGGELLVSGTDVRNVTQHDLRARIGYVPQQGVLLSGTIESNLRYGDRNASDETVEACAGVAQALEFIKEKPDGLQESIAQGGTNVSGGQKQRLSIARALVKNPDVLIFDDSFSALDFKTDVALRRALKEYTAQSAVIVVAQRVNTIMNAERIIVLEHGRIVGDGTHKELLRSCPQYLEIASTQMTEEELA